MSPVDSDLRKVALAMPGKNWKLQTRLLVREDASLNKPEPVKKITKEIMGRIGRGSQVGAWYQDELAYRMSVVI
jgi:hypothetical protein